MGKISTEDEHTGPTLPHGPGTAEDGGQRRTRLNSPLPDRLSIPIQQMRTPGNGEGMARFNASIAAYVAAIDPAAPTVRPRKHRLRNGR